MVTTDDLDLQVHFLRILGQALLNAAIDSFLLIETFDKGHFALGRFLQFAGRLWTNLLDTVGPRFHLIFWLLEVSIDVLELDNCLASSVSHELGLGPRT